MADGRKEKGRKNGARGKIIALAQDYRAKQRDEIPYSIFRVKMKDSVKKDWEYINQFGFTGSKVFEAGVKACMNELVGKRIDEQLYGEYEAFAMQKRRQTKYGIKLETKAIRHKLHYSAKCYQRIIIISLTPSPKGENRVIIRYYTVENNCINRKKIHSMSKRVDLIDKEILLFFANGGVHPS